MLGFEVNTYLPSLRAIINKDMTKTQIKPDSKTPAYTAVNTTDQQITTQVGKVWEVSLVFPSSKKKRVISSDMSFFAF